MNDYKKVVFAFSPCSETAADVLSALLADIGFESFVPDDSGLTAYAPLALFDDVALAHAVACFPLEGYKIEYSAETVEGRDWNEEWEKNYFKPIIIDDACVIHSTFHTDVPSARYDILIDPKMAFGTGYHNTTCHILHAILGERLDGCSLLDMGCGTALLAILARKHGASSVVAIDIDEFAYENARENVVLNGTPDIDVRLGGVEALRSGERFDYILANINRQILLADMECYSEHMHTGSVIFMSGFYVEDMDMLRIEAERCGLRYDGCAEKERWAMMRFVKE